MADRDGPTGDCIDPVPFLNLAVLGVAPKSVATAGDKVEDPSPFLFAQIAIGMGGPHLGEEVVRSEAAAHGHGDDMLRQKVERPLDRPPRLDGPLAQRVTGRSDVDQVERVGRDASQPADGARSMAAAARALDEPAHGLGTAYLKNPIDRREVHA